MELRGNAIVDDCRHIIVPPSLQDVRNDIFGVAEAYARSGRQSLEGIRAEEIDKDRLAHKAILMFKRVWSKSASSERPEKFEVVLKVEGMIPVRFIL